MPSEAFARTEHAQIYHRSKRRIRRLPQLDEGVDALLQAAQRSDLPAVYAGLHTLVPEYRQLRPTMTSCAGPGRAWLSAHHKVRQRGSRVSSQESFGTIRMHGQSHPFRHGGSAVPRADRQIRTRRRLAHRLGGNVGHRWSAADALRGPGHGRARHRCFEPSFPLGGPHAPGSILADPGDGARTQGVADLGIPRDCRSCLPHHRNDRRWSRCNRSRDGHAPGPRATPQMPCRQLLVDGFDRIRTLSRDSNQPQSPS